MSPAPTKISMIQSPKTHTMTALTDVPTWMGEFYKALLLGEDN